MNRGADKPRSFGHESCPHRIDGERTIGITFARIDSSPGRGMHDRIGLELDNGSTHRIAVGDVEACMIETSNLMSAGAENAYEFVADLTTSAGDENSHQ